LERHVDDHSARDRLLPKKSPDFFGLPVALSIRRTTLHRGGNKLAIRGNPNKKLSQLLGIIGRQIRGHLTHSRIIPLSRQVEERDVMTPGE